MSKVIMRKLSGTLKYLASKMGRNEECNVVIVGLDNSGKSTIINFLQDAKENGPNETVPTIGYRVETFSRKNLNFTVFDMSGQGKYRNLWEKQYQQVHAIIFVVDSADKMRVCVAKDELDLILSNPEVEAQTIPILFLANKQDCSEAMTPTEILHKLDLQKITERPWSIVGTNALGGEGIEQAIEWLADNVTSMQEEKRRHK